ncbi:MAG: YciI family protein [Ramlibacter sp.]|nr:YciI family protein [Ramlibacter sp.]
MQFTLMIFEAPDGFAARTDSKQQKSYWSGTFAFLSALKEEGVFRGGAGLQTPDTATTLRYSNGNTALSDGPAPAAAEQLGGYFIVDVPDLDHALDWAARFPQRPGVAVEVRPNLAHD